MTRVSDYAHSWLESRNLEVLTDEELEELTIRTRRMRPSIPMDAVRIRENKFELMQERSYRHTKRLLEETQDERANEY